MTDGVLHISPGDVVSGLEPDDLVEVQRIAPFGNKRLVEGVGMESRRVIKRPLSDEEISRLVVVRGKAHSFNGDPGMFLLAAEAERIRIAYQFDPLFAVNSSIVDPLPHQVEAVYRYLLPLPRIRFLLADDTGAGKTIMAGLLIKELLFRGVLKKVLIMTPGGLTKQWLEEELQEKFGFYARLVNRASFDAEPGQFIRYEEGLEQRMGRIHRYGQNNDVWVYNLVAQNTREGAVIQKVLMKLDVMRDQMGSDRVYDVIDDWLQDVPLVKLIEMAIDSEGDPEGATAHAENALTVASREKAENLISLQKKTSLASRLDLRSARELWDASDEHRLQPLFVQRFFERAWKACGGTMRKDEDFPVWHIGHTPTALMDLSRVRRVPVPDHYDTPFVFDKQLVSVASKVKVPDRTKLLGPGHALFETLIEWTIAQSREAFARGAVLVDPNIARPQRIWLVRSTIEDGRIETRRRLAHEQLSVIAEDHMGLRTTSPSYLLNCVPPENIPELPHLPERSVEEIQSFAYEKITEGQLEQVKAARVEECNLRQDYLNNAFADLIMELQGKLNDLQQSSLFGEQNADERARLERRIDELKNRKAERLSELQLMERLTGNLPDVLTQAIVTPPPVALMETDEASPGKGFPMRRDDEVEAIAMDVAMRYERSRGWNPYDVSRNGEHYDIRSESPAGEKRFIEVKGRAQSGAIVITGPELDKLRQLADRAWLYVITYCKTEKPRLQIIQDPIRKLNPEMLYRQVQFMVEEKDWAGQGEEVKEHRSLT